MAVALVPGKPCQLDFAKDFVCQDQSIADLQAGVPKPETSWCLLELPKDQLKILEDGGEFRFVGNSHDGQALLCLGNASYEMEFLENSNSQYIGVLQGPDPSKPKEPLATEEKVEKPAQEKAEKAAEEKTDKPADDKAGKEDAAPKDDGKLAAESCAIFAHVAGQMILKPVAGDATSLRDLLMPHALGQDTPVAGLSLTTLQYSVGACLDELKKMLSDGPYVEVNGLWCYIPESLEYEIVDAAGSLIIAKGWKAEAVDKEDLFREVQQHLGEASLPSLEVLQQALRSTKIEEKKKEEPAKKDEAKDKDKDKDKDKGAAKDKPADAAAADAAKAAADALAAAAPEPVIDPTKFALDKQKLDRVRMLQILRQPPARARERFQLGPPPPRAKRARTAGGREAQPLGVDELMQIYQEMHGGEEAKQEDVLKLLGQNVVVDEIDKVVHYLDINALPDNPHERIKKLFELFTHWKGEVLGPLVAPSLKGQKVDPWLMKWTRTVFPVIPPSTEETRMLTPKFMGMM